MQTLLSRTLRLILAACVLAAALFTVTAPALPAHAAVEVPVPITGVKHLQVSAYSGCAKHIDGSLLCWGASYGSTAAIQEQTGIVAQVAHGYQHRCVLTTTGAVTCSGSNTYGQLGIGNTDGQGDNWVQPNGLNGGVARLAVGLRTSCALMDDGTVRCWGLNDRGQVGILFLTPSVKEPTQVPGLSDIKQLAAGSNHFCAIDGAADMLCWGDNEYGQIGDGTDGNVRSVVTPVINLLNPRFVTAGAHHTCASTITGAVFCWGRNQYGQLGDGSTTPRTTPVAVVGLDGGVTDIVAGLAHSCAATNDKNAFCWGKGVSGQLGNGESGAGVQTEEPVAVLEIAGQATGLSAGYEATCATNTDRGVHCWGFGGPGTIGDGAGVNRALPSRVALLLTCYAVTPAFTGQGGLPTIAPANSLHCPAGHYTPGTLLTITDNPAPGWRTTQWLANDSASGQDQESFLFTVETDLTLTAQYDPCFALTIAHIGPGSAPTTAPGQSKGCAAGRYVIGEPIALTASPAPGATLTAWSGTNNDASVAAANALTMPAADRAVSVTYTVIDDGAPFDVTARIYLPFAFRE